MAPAEQPCPPQSRRPVITTVPACANRLTSKKESAPRQIINPLPPPTLPSRKIAVRTVDRYSDIHRLLREGCSVSAIARRLHLDRKTVRRFRDRDLDMLLASARMGRPKGVLEPFTEYLTERFTGRVTSPIALYREIQERDHQAVTCPCAATWRDFEPAPSIPPAALSPAHARSPNGSRLPSPPASPSSRARAWSRTTSTASRPSSEPRTGEHRSTSSAPGSCSDHDLGIHGMWPALLPGGDRPGCGGAGPGGEASMHPVGACPCRVAVQGWQVWDREGRPGPSLSPVAAGQPCLAVEEGDGGSGQTVRRAASTVRSAGSVVSW